MLVYLSSSHSSAYQILDWLYVTFLPTTVRMTRKHGLWKVPCIRLFDPPRLPIRVVKTRGDRKKDWCLFNCILFVLVELKNKNLLFKIYIFPYGFFVFLLLLPKSTTWRDIYGSSHDRLGTLKLTESHFARELSTPRRNIHVCLYIYM